MLDVAWLVGFVAVFGYLLFGPQAGGPLRSAVELRLVSGTQYRGIYRDDLRLGGLAHQVARSTRGWRIDERLALGERDHEIEVGRATLELRRDLSLETLGVEADLSKLGSVIGIPAAMANQLGVGAVKIDGHCEGSTGQCIIVGDLGSNKIDRRVEAGRGPMLPSAIYPLLARGALGKTVELAIFDPLSLSRRIVTYRLQGQHKVKVLGQAFDAMLVEQDVAGLTSRLWLDRRGRVLKEQLPFGLSIQHEGFSDGDTG